MAIKNIARACGDEISEVQPLLDARLEDGSRVAAMFPRCAVAGPHSRSGSSRVATASRISVTVGTITPVIATQLTAHH